MATLFVTGGAGFIGSCFVRKIISQRTHRVINLDKLTYAGNLASLGSCFKDPHHRFIQGDIADAETVEDIFQIYQPDAVVHFAAETHVDRSIDSPAPFLHTNVQGTFVLLESARHYFKTLPASRQEKFRFLQVSSDEVYGSLGAEGRFLETSPFDPNSPYSASKAAADLFAQAYFRTYGLPVIVTHSSNNYGPYQYPEKLIPLMILNAVEGRPLPLYGDGKNVRDWLYVEDHCRALEEILARGRSGEAYNVAGGCELTNLEVVQTICRVVDDLCPQLPHHPCSSLMTFVDDRPGHDRRYALDTQKIHTELGWQPTVDFLAGIQLTVQWYLKHAPWIEAVSCGKYHRQRLGLAA
jgi:dTDP-glucose 4,6-dehydratase